MKEINITITAVQWPDLQIIVTCGPHVRTDRSFYDSAASNFEPAVRDAMKQAVADLIRSNKGA